MKLGTIVGIVFSCLLIIGGVILCCIGTSIAEENGQVLFTQKNENGTYHKLVVDENITRIDLSLENVDVVVSGNADVSEIEFYNFNPNNYALSVTTNVISFEETPKIESVTDILSSGINFKGLRYALDFKSYKYESDDKRVVINLAKNADIKVLDISAEKGSVDISRLDTASDITISLVRGKIELNDIKTTSVVDVKGTAIDTIMSGLTAVGFKYTADKSDLIVTDSQFGTSQVTVADGSVSYSLPEACDKTQLTASSDTGSIMVNSISSSSPFKLECEEHDKTVDIKCKSATINITYSVTESTDGENE